MLVFQFHKDYRHYLKKVFMASEPETTIANSRLASKPMSITNPNEFEKYLIENHLVINFYLTKFRFCRIFVISIGVKINKNNIIQ